MSLTDEQRALRLGRIGSSQIAAVVGMSPFRRPIDVYLEATDPEYQQEPNPLLEIGTLLEPVVLELYRRRTGRTAVPGITIVSERHPFAVATPDGFSGPNCVDAEDRVIEAKTCLGFNAGEWGEPGTDQVPPAYLLQTQWQMGLCREAGMPIESADVPVLIGGHDFRIYSVPWDETLFGQLVEAGARFHRDFILPKRPPPPDDSAHYEQFLRWTYRAPKAELRTATDEHARVVRELAQDMRAAKELERRIQAARNRLMADVADAEGLQGDGWQVTWKATKKGTRVFKTKFQGDEA